MAIIQRIKDYSDYPHTAIKSDAMSHVLAIYAKLPECELRYRKALLTQLECFLSITGKTLDQTSFSSGTFNFVAKDFIGALLSPHFIELGQSALKKYLSLWYKLCELLGVQFGALGLPTFSLSASAREKTLKPWAGDFSSQELIEEKVWLWTGWLSFNRKGKKIVLPLYPVFVRHGREFTEKLYAALDQFYSSGNYHIIPCARTLIKFISDGNYRCTVDDFDCPRFMSQFWRDFFVHYVSTKYSNKSSSQIATLMINWRNNFTYLVKSFLVPHGVFVEQWGAFPSPPAKLVPGAKTNIVMTAEGYGVKTNLITHIPLQLTDDQAIEILFNQIESEIKIITDWAEIACDEIWRKYLRRRDLEKIGSPREVQNVGGNTGGHKWKTDRKNIDYLANAAATFNRDGFNSDPHRLRVLYPTPLWQTAIELGLPITDALFPHCCLLVANHPSITPSFLEGFELYNINGALTGFTKTDNGARLVGHKDRAGDLHSQQIVHLNETTIKIVEQIIAITAPLRDYLKSRADDNWRYLLLTCQRGFGYPHRVQNLATTTSDKPRKAILISSIVSLLGKHTEEVSDLINRFSLRALRASCGVVVYLKTQSVEKMSIALGHVRYDPRLLDRYLPAPLKEFFQERWIRIFQTGIIVESLRDSTHLLKAADFENREELQTFLTNHALDFSRIPGQPTETNKIRPTDREVVFGVNTEILTALLTLQKSSETNQGGLDGKSNYWAAISKHLVTYIREELKFRSDIQSYLQQAENQIKLIRDNHV
jgi:hypothetical protein